MRLFAAPWRRKPAEESADAGLEGLARRLQQISEGHAIPAEHAATARSRMRLALAATRNRQPAAGAAWRSRAGRPLVAATAVAVVLIAGAAMSLLLGGAGGPAGLIGSRTAEAVVLTGTLEAQGNGFTLLTDSGPRQIAIGPQALVVDAAGNPVPVDSLTRGQQLSVKAKRDDNDRLVVDEIHAESEVRGRITSRSANQIQVTGERTSITVLISDTTRVKGNLTLGQLVEVKVERNAAGVLVAREIDAEDEEHDKAAPGLPAAPTASAAPARTAAAPSPSATPERARETKGEGDDLAQQPAPAPAPQPTASSGPGGGSGGGGSHDGRDDEHDDGHDR